MIKAAVVGASGYSGAELVKILAGHPNVELSAITSISQAGRPITELYPNLLGLVDMGFTDYSPMLAADNDIVFLALPHGEAMKLAPELISAGQAKLVDISGDFRLPPDVYEFWYKRAHTAPELAGEAIYGLSELNKEAITRARLVANPGCYPTGVILAIAPLLKAGQVGGAVVANCLSGVSGAGRAFSEVAHFCRADENVAAYKVGGAHQHIPEIEAMMGKLTATAPGLVFTPQLGPFARGIYTVATVPASKTVKADEVRGIYEEFYAGKPFIKMLAPGSWPQVKAVSGSNYCHIGVALDERAGHIIAISAIDNLVKGAAGQAVQNMNLMFGFDETTGLTQAGLYP